MAIIEGRHQTDTFVGTFEVVDGLLYGEDLRRRVPEGWKPELDRTWSSRSIREILWNHPEALA